MYNVYTHMHCTSISTCACVYNVHVHCVYCVRVFVCLNTVYTCICMLLFIFEVFIDLFICQVVTDDDDMEGEPEEEDNDVEELLGKLREVTEMFDERNNNYLRLEASFEQMKKVSLTGRMGCLHHTVYFNRIWASLNQPSMPTTTLLRCIKSN